MLAETEQLLRCRHRADDATVRRVLDYAAAVVEGGSGTCAGCGFVLTTAPSLQRRPPL